MLSCRGKRSDETPPTKVVFGGSLLLLVVRDDSTDSTLQLNKL